ncbi:MAG: Ig-like domain repeat protein, partial [Armatimonadetes bacterium]|nr:Ig-like domain repeat protein [Armatimonadota bacterium]
MNDRRTIFGLVELNGLAYAMGGYDRPRYFENPPRSTILDTVEVYDSTADTWTYLAPMLSRRSAVSAAVSQGKIYAIGGSDETNLLNSVERYDPTTNTWSYVAPLNIARSGHSVAVTPDGKIYVIGGYDGVSEINSVEVYNPTDNTWSFAASMQTTRSGAAATLGIDGNIYIAGGWHNDQAEVLNTGEVYDPRTNQWANINSMTTPRASFALVSGTDGRLYAIGGNTFSQTLSSLEAYTIPPFKTKITASNVAVYYGKSVTLSATLKNGIDGSPIPNKQIAFSLEGSPVGSGTTNASGKATLLVANPLAYHVETSHAIVASFAGAGSYKPSSGIATLTVNKADTLIKVGTFSGGPGDKKSLTAVLRRRTDTLPLSAQTLTFKIDGNTIGSGITDGTGKATFLYKIDETYRVGAHVLTAEFAGDNDHSLSTGTGTLTIRKSETKTVVNAIAGKIGDTKTLYATLKRKPDSAPLTLKALTFKVNGISVGIVNTDANGKAALSYKIDESLGVGAQSITVEYAGGDFYNAS